MIHNSAMNETSRTSWSPFRAKQEHAQVACNLPVLTRITEQDLPGASAIFSRAGLSLLRSREVRLASGSAAPPIKNHAIWMYLLLSSKLYRMPVGRVFILDRGTRTW